MARRLPWFRVYCEARIDRKLDTLTDAEFRIWFNLLCLSAEDEPRGVVGPIPADVLAVEVARGDTEAMDATIAKCERLRIIEVCRHTIVDGDETPTPDDVRFMAFTSFARRQYDAPSDSPEAIAQRVRKHRGGKR